ncbi:MAG: hypothetical protein IPL79_00575 [Myxococcales bacterium]|nr:hypothetical protein [Myxococcales bacterium]
MAVPPPAGRDASSDAGGRAWPLALVAMQAGLLAGGLIGLADALLRLGAAREFVHGAQLVPFVGYVTCAYAAACGWLALGGALAWRGVALIAGETNPVAMAFAAIARHHHQARQTGQPAALWPLAATLVALIAFASAGYVVFHFGSLALEGRKRHDLVVLIAMLGVLASSRSHSPRRRC